MTRHEIVSKIPTLTYVKLYEIAKLLRVYKYKMVKGGIKKRCTKEELIKNIRREIGRNPRCDLENVERLINDERIVPWWSIEIESPGQVS